MHGELPERVVEAAQQQRFARDLFVASLCLSVTPRASIAGEQQASEK